MTDVHTTPAATPQPRPTREPMGLRNIRTGDDLWSDFRDLCADNGTDVSADLRDYMHRQLKAARRRGWKSSRGT